jgi:hypothetical protein
MQLAFESECVRPGKFQLRDGEVLARCRLTVYLGPNSDLLTVQAACASARVSVKPTRQPLPFFLLRTTLPRITRSAPFPPVSSRGARRCREPVFLPISTTEETHETLDIGLGLWPLSDLYIMRGCTGSLYIDVRPLRGKTGICPYNPN